MTVSLGPYELRGELGRGAMAVVWRGWDTRLEREVAIKEPTLPSSADSALAHEFSERFVREGKAAAKLNHPGIVTIFNADVYDGRPAIVMELIDGETLADLLGRGPLQPAAALAILDQLLEAVAYAHERGVVHRDIKPDNVFVTSDGRVKLTDFGIAHVGADAALTQAGTVMGTPGYMAPEQVTGNPVDARADLFAIGAIAYEMLAGRNPFGATDGAAPTTVMYRIVHEQPPELDPPGAVESAPHLAEMIRIALEKERDRRFPDAAAFRTSLRGGVPHWSAAPAASALPAPESPFRRGMLPYALIGLAGIVAIGILVVSATSGTPAGGPSTGASFAGADTAEEELAAVVPPSEPADGARPLDSDELEGELPQGHPPIEGMAPELPDRATAESEIRSLLERWRVSREQLDFATYASFYATDFHSAEDNLSYAEWYERKRRIYQTTSPPSVSLGSPNFMWSTDGYLATVVFDQTYRSGSVNEDGEKQLQIEWADGMWLITSEDYTLHRKY